MTKSINKQVEAQGVKKLDSFKGFETLNSKELQEIEGGSWIGDAWNFIKKHTRVVIMTIRDQVTGDYIATGVGIEVR
ncbi:ComC/BlpC family leader-containing pheromone/bacteriocin [Capnocytophaga leadbetteri]|jgi:hypothetical protein|uniref:ComC/BlpC family leader-containing pheromone/bacteriocin n=2 Tax=Capnocytophaga leadbetteri TaxID=327575 RepID=UPI0026EFEDA8|nr:ComC/BlpC family leader-containing pheromone/bacteriocin [Capnocytophaga leadbetteri]